MRESKMHFKRIVGIVVLVIGVVLVGFSIYIKTQVAEGKEEVSRAQRRVDQGNSLFSLTPVTKGIGKGISGSAQEKINEGVRKIGEYSSLASGLEIGGIILILAGLGIILVAKR
jgi:hypothetical protein